MIEARDMVDEFQISIQHVFRKGNLVADTLAASAFTKGNRKSYNHYHQLLKM